MAYSHVNSKGQTYYLHANKIERSSGKVTTLYYFSREVKSEKALDEVGEGATEEEKAVVREKIDALKKALEGDDVEALKTAKDELTEAFHPIAEKMYQKAAAEQQAAQGAQGAPDMGADMGSENVDDADYEVVDDDK